MNGAQRITVVTYVVLALAGVIPLFIFPAVSAGRLFGNYVLLYLVVAGVSWWAFGNRHPMAKAGTRLITAVACLVFSMSLAAFYWATA